MTTRFVNSLAAVLSAGAILLTALDGAQAISGYQGGHGYNPHPPLHGPGSSHNPIVHRPVHGPGSSHNPIIYRPVHGPGSSHNPIIYHPGHGSGSSHNHHDWGWGWSWRRWYGWRERPEIVVESVPGTGAVSSVVRSEPAARVSAAAPQMMPTETMMSPCTCLTKQTLSDGRVIFADTCTKETAIAPPQEVEAR